MGGAVSRSLVEGALYPQLGNPALRAPVNFCPIVRPSRRKLAEQRSTPPVPDLFGFGIPTMREHFLKLHSMNVLCIFIYYYIVSQSKLQSSLYVYLS
jgi:hypothetical protein